jgi:hypothetical protein
MNGLLNWLREGAYFFTKIFFDFANLNRCVLKFIYIDMFCFEVFVFARLVFMQEIHLIYIIEHDFILFNHRIIKKLKERALGFGDFNPQKDQMKKIVAMPIPFPFIIIKKINILFNGMNMTKFIIPPLIIILFHLGQESFYLILKYHLPLINLEI